MLNEKPKALSEHDVQKLILAMAKGQGAITVEQTAKFLEWAEGVKIDNALVDLVLAGDLYVKYGEDDNYTFIDSRGKQGGVPS